MSENAGKPAEPTPQSEDINLNDVHDQNQAPEQADPQQHDPVADLTAQLAQARTEVEKAKEVYLRLAADMENLRRRTQEDVAKAHKFAIEGFAESLLPVRDSLEMALSVQGQSPEALREGVEATLRQLEAAFERGKVVMINPVGEKFDPNSHQAVAMVPGNSVEPPVPANHVVAVLQKGYSINERVLRPALVSVAQ